jgi:hypothetical protein
MRRFQGKVLGVVIAVCIAIGLIRTSALADGFPATADFVAPNHHHTSFNSTRNNPSGQHYHPLRIQQIFVVSERNPLTGELVSAPRRFSSRLEATLYRESLRSAAWVVWRYVGIGEPLRSVRFTNRFDAEQFVRTGGPARRGFLGSLLLTQETRILPSKVSLDIDYVR